MVAARVWSVTVAEISLSGSWCKLPVFPGAVNNGETQERRKEVRVTARWGKAEAPLMSWGGAIKAAAAARRRTEVES